MTPATGCTPTSPRPSSPRCAPSSPPTDGARRETETALRPAALPRRTNQDCLAEELRRLDPDEVFGAVLHRGL
ncbi:OpcA/G6PD domain-containing protein, partial [Micrococcus luteus]|uniref:OpcA/G6PD domain-containing protein n=1 Tax=Micrococcus luteus TaxID=1270 RepID=UPI003F4D152C